MRDVSIRETTEAVNALRGFIPSAQLELLGDLCRGEEGQFFRAKLVEYAERVAAMPKTYEQDGMGDRAIAYLHYFTGQADWYITEKDMEAEQVQAFGHADLGFGCGEYGYISLIELCGCASVEIDLYFTPAPIDEILRSKAA